jgi:hypothetical protein
VNPNDSRTVEALGDALSSLIANEPHSRIDLTEWIKQSRKALALVAQLSKSGIAVPELIYHYLSDADIRLKSSDYAEVQVSRVRQLALLFSRGIVEGANEI